MPPVPLLAQLPANAAPTNAAALRSAAQPVPGPSAHSPAQRMRGLVLVSERMRGLVLVSERRRGLVLVSRRMRGLVLVSGRMRGLVLVRERLQAYRLHAYSLQDNSLQAYRAKPRPPSRAQVRTGQLSSAGCRGATVRGVPQVPHSLTA